MTAIITSTTHGVMINVRVIPRAGHTGIAGIRGDALLIRLRAPPVEGAANDELIEVLAGVFALPKRAVNIIAGERSRSKQVIVTGITAEQASRSIERFAASL